MYMILGVFDRTLILFEELINMNKCKVYIGNHDTGYEGQYEFVDNFLEVEIFQYYASNDDYVHPGENVKYKEITIVDLRNKVFAFSPLFYNVGITFALMQYEKYKTDFYFKTGQVESVEAFSSEMKINKLIIYNPILAQCFTNPALQITYNEKEVDYKIINDSEKKVIEVQENNIEKMEFGGKCTYSRLNNGQLINIEVESYAKVYLLQPITYEEFLMYINEFDVFINAYCLGELRSYSTLVTTNEDKCFEVVHKLLGKEKFCKKTLYKPVNMGFFKYIETMYKYVHYRTADDKNKFIPLEFKKPTSLEDQFIFYFRYIDLYMGEYLEKKNKKEPSNYERLSAFVDENLQLFDDVDVVNVDNLKNELNSLRNQYVHEGYYLPNDQFSVRGKRREFLYYKNMDYNWLFRIVKVLKYGVYRSLYTSVLNLDINESELKNALSLWF